MLNYLMSYSYSYSYGYDDYYGSSSVDDAAVGLFAGGMLIFIFLLALIPTVLSIVAQWKIFTKAGEAGWKAIIPIYNMVVLCQIVNINPLWILALLIPGINGLAGLALSIFIAIRLCKGFGKSDGFIIGYVLLSFVFQLILAFDKSTWDKSRIDMNSLSFLNKDKAPAAATAPAGGEPTAAAGANTTPEDPWVAGDDKPKA